MGELRDRMVRDMDVRHFSGRTVEAYVAGVKGLARYYRRSPDQLSDDRLLLTPATRADTQAELMLPSPCGAAAGEDRN